MLSRPAPPVRPTVAPFTDIYGLVDYEAFDDALGKYLDAYEVWHEDHGDYFWQVEHCWARREFELSAGAR